MTSVLVVNDELSHSTQLVHLATQRGIDAMLSSQKELTKSNALVLSQKVLKKFGGLEALVAQCRDLAIRKIIVTDIGNGQSVGIKTSYGGAVIELSGKKEDFPFIAEIVIQFLGGGNGFAAGDSKTFELLALANRVAQSEVTVFIHGPTGTGKEVLAKYVHQQSDRKEKPFIAVNCAAIPDNMLEAMLFGYEKGAFTGASTANKGIFRAADKGTLLLDEISEMPLNLQAKILRVLQERIVTPLGGQRDIPIDVRVIATTNRNMPEEVQNGKFREDLYYRLNVFPLETMLLSNRIGDLLPVTTAIIYKHIKKIDHMPWLSIDAINILEKHLWPGNIRELENVLQRALVLSSNNLITKEDIMIDTSSTPSLKILEKNSNKNQDGTKTLAAAG
ncbi:MAG: hypothetical protein CBC47_08315 [Alphaproteobacteria bacterium TMED87]|nr:AAA family ATPase [Rhodospirillaceae bacterium]OUV07917.1 MAG: hypothetical protein CBC47_08315 [Alphaproteobacteria bacterium TMED87]